MRKCSGCNQEKTLDNFYRRKTGLAAGKYYEKCKDCQRDRGRTYYQQNREKQSYLALLRKRKYQKERHKFVQGFKKDKPCMDCGGIFPSWVMDFDHREGELKIGSVSRLASTDALNLEKIRIEIAKCDLVCANCHRTRTYKRMHKDI